VVAVPHSQPNPQERVTAAGAFELIQGSLSAKRVERRNPLLAGLHRAADGGLVGVFAAVLVLSGFTLHWQYRWTLAFERLEETRDVGHRLTESTAMLERYLLDRTRTPKSLIPTTASKLLYLERPREEQPVASNDPLAFISTLMGGSIHHGY